MNETSDKTITVVGTSGHIKVIVEARPHESVKDAKLRCKRELYKIIEAGEMLQGEFRR